MIRRDLKNMKKRRAAICFLMVFIMSFTLLPSGVFAAQNDSLKAKQQLAEQSRKFDGDNCCIRRNEGKRDVCKGCV